MIFYWWEKVQSGNWAVICEIKEDEENKRFIREQQVMDGLSFWGLEDL